MRKKEENESKKDAEKLEKPEERKPEKIARETARNEEENDKKTPIVNSKPSKKLDLETTDAHATEKPNSMHQCEVKPDSVKARIQKFTAKFANQPPTAVVCLKPPRKLNPKIHLQSEPTPFHLDKRRPSKKETGNQSINTEGKIENRT